MTPAGVGAAVSEWQHIQPHVIGERCWCQEIQLADALAAAVEMSQQHCIVWNEKHMLVAMGAWKTMVDAARAYRAARGGA